jgi:cytochrome P450
MTSRECVEDITIEGIFIPKGTVIYIDFMGIHHR